MASTNSKACEGSLGTPLYLSYAKEMAFKFHDFEGLSIGSQYVTTPAECHGHQWRLQIYPYSSTMSVYLYHSGQDLVKPLRAKISIQIHKKKTEGEYTFTSNATYYTWSECMKRSEAIEALDEYGTLVVTVRLRCMLNAKPTWRPESPVQRKLRLLYNSDASMDIAFLMNNGDMVRAHKAVVFLHCPLLDQIASDSANASRITVEGSDPDLFATMIRFMYYEDLPNTFNIYRDGLDLLKLANKYEYTDLKIHLECDLIHCQKISVENAAEILLLADSHSLALLKEEALEFVLSNFAAVKATDGWKDLKESSTLLGELLEAQLVPKSGDDEGVSSLRKKLADIGQDIDGTKEMLVQRLKEEMLIQRLNVDVGIESPVTMTGNELESY